MFAIVRGNGSAPTANRLADWLGELKPLADHPNAKFEAIPMTTEADLTAVNEAHGARKIDFTIPVEDLEGLGVSLSADLRKAADIAPGVELGYGAGALGALCRATVSSKKVISSRWR